MAHPLYVSSPATVLVVANVTNPSLTLDQTLYSAGAVQVLSRLGVYIDGRWGYINSVHSGYVAIGNAIGDAYDYFLYDGGSVIGSGFAMLGVVDDASFATVTALNNSTQTTTPTARFINSNAAIGPSNVGGDGARGLVGSIAEIMVWDRVLSSGELATVKTYLNGKYALGLT